MHKMRTWFVQMKGTCVLDITLKIPLQKPQVLPIFKKNFYKKDLTK